MVCGCLEAILGRLEMSVQSRRMMGFHEVAPKSLRIEDTQARAIVTPVRFLAGAILIFARPCSNICRI